MASRSRLHGGVILDLSGYNAFGWVRAGAGRAQAGIRLAEFDRQARPQGLGTALVAVDLSQRHARRTLRRRLRRRRLHHLWSGRGHRQRARGARDDVSSPSPGWWSCARPRPCWMHHVYGANGIVLELEVVALAPALELGREHRRPSTAFDAGPRIRERARQRPRAW